MKYIVAISYFFVAILAFGQQQVLTGTWYRNDLFAEATLKIDPDLHFGIEAYHTAHSGEIDGTLTKVTDSVYFAKVDEPDIQQACIMVFLISKKNISIKLFGDEVGAGASVYYEGTYVRAPLTEAEQRYEALKWILSSHYAEDSVIKLLGNNVDYFVGRFEARSSAPSQDDFLSWVYQGFLPGAAPYQNGIFAVGSKYIYILFLDSRSNPPEFQYYTNDPTRRQLPKTFLVWIGDRSDYRVILHAEK